MKFYKLDERSHSHISIESAVDNDNVYVEDDVMLWAKDVARMNELDVQVTDIEVAVEVLDRFGEYLTRIV